MTRKRSSNGSPTVNIKKPPSFTAKEVPKPVQKLHCFFCYRLTDNVQSYNDSSKEPRSDIIISKENERNKQMEIFLRFCSQVSTSKSGRRRNEEKFQLLARKCGVCDDCFNVIENYCSIYQQTEYLNLRLRWRLDKIQLVMKYAGKVPSRIKAFKESFQNNGGVQQDFTEVTQIRQKLFDACSKRLKIKNPVVMLSPINIINDASSQNLDQTLENETIGNEEDADTSDLTEPDNLDDTSSAIVTHSNEDSNSEVMYVIKAEGSNGDKFVTPPESVLEALQSGDLPAEGVTKHHYFYCTTVPDSGSTIGDSSSTKSSTNEILPSPSTDIQEKGSNNAMDLDLDDLIGNPNECLGIHNLQSAAEKENEEAKRNKIQLYKCIKCAETFPSEELIIRHARMGNCFTEENIDVTRSPPPPTISERRDVASANQKRKRPSSENLIEQNAKKLKEAPENPVSANRKTSNLPNSGGNVISSALDKMLSGLRPTLICPNCSESFSAEEQFKGHLIARECFRDIKKRSAAEASQRKMANDSFSNDDDDENNSDLSSLSESSHEEDSDSDYAPKLRDGRAITRKAKPNKTNGSGKKVKEKEVSKTSCPVDNCDKFFLYKEDLDRHLKEKHELFACQWCSYTTDQANGITSHEILTHSKNLNGYAICPRCPATITLSSDKVKQVEHYLKRHLSSSAAKTKNDKKIQLECNKCGKCFKGNGKGQAEYSLKRHIKSAHPKNKR